MKLSARQLEAIEILKNKDLLKQIETFKGEGLVTGCKTQTLESLQNKGLISCTYIMLEGVVTSDVVVL